VRECSCPFLFRSDETDQATQFCEDRKVAVLATLVPTIIDSNTIVFGRKNRIWRFATTEAMSCAVVEIQILTFGRNGGDCSTIILALVFAVLIDWSGFPS
jgi:hypothetical protein